MAADAGPRAAEAVAWLQDQLRSERQDIQARHDGMLWGLEQVLRQHADAADEAEARRMSTQSLRSENPMRATGELLEVAVRVTGSARVPDAEVIEFVSTDNTEDAPDSEARNDDMPHKCRSSKELTDDALRDRGLDLGMTADRSDRPPAYSRYRAAQDAGGTSCGTWICLVWALVQYYSGWIVKHPMFDYCMGVVIVANCVCIGLEIDTTVDGSEPATELQVLEHLFLTIYVVELTMHVLGGWKTCWSNAWFQFDLFLVILGILSIWVLQPVTKPRGGGKVAHDGDAVDVLRKILIIRILRLVNLTRALRFTKLMRPLWKLISGLLGSVHTVMSAAILLLGSIYAFACVGVSLVAQDRRLRHDIVAGPIIEEYFQSVPSLMLTLIQFTSCDSVAAIYNPLVQVKPILILYFLPIIIVVPITLMNLITAVIVDTAIKASAHDAELERARMRRRLKKLIPLLTRIFKDLDRSNDGKIDLAELDLTKVSGMPSEVMDVLTSHKLKDFFSHMDADASGTIDLNEWLDGMCCLILNEVPIENLQMLHQLSRQAADLQALRRALLPDDGHGQPAAAGAHA